MIQLLKGEAPRSVDLATGTRNLHQIASTGSDQAIHFLAGLLTEIGTSDIRNSSTARFRLNTLKRQAAHELGDMDKIPGVNTEFLKRYLELLQNYLCRSLLVCSAKSANGLVENSEGFSVDWISQRI